MGDSRQRLDLQERIVALEKDLAAYFATAHPSMEQIRQPITHALADARMFLNMESVRENYFLPFALMYLESAERQFEKTKVLLDKYGGPENARVVGSG